MRRLGQVLTAAAALVAGGLGLNVALRQAGQELTPPMTCREWSALVQQAGAEQPIEWFVALQDGFNPPTAAGDRILGNCAGGECVVEPQGCPVPAKYTYERSAAAGGWRLFKVRGHRYFALAWKALAAESPDEVRFASGWAEVGAQCLALATAAQCRALLNGAGACWKRPGGFYCRHGRLYGPGVGGVNADGTAATCTPQAGDVPYPCNAPGDAGWADRVVAETFPSDGDLDR